MIESLLARYPPKRAVLVAERGLLSVNNLDELAKLQATLAGEGRTVSLEYFVGPAKSGFRLRTVHDATREGGARIRRDADGRAQTQCCMRP